MADLFPSPHSFAVRSDIRRSTLVVDLLGSDTDGGGPNTELADIDLYRPSDLAGRTMRKPPPNASRPFRAKTTFFASGRGETSGAPPLRAAP